MNSEEIHVITPKYDSFGLRNTNGEITDVIQYENVRIIIQYYVFNFKRFTLF